MIRYCKSCGSEYKGDYCENCGYGKPAERAKAFEKYRSNRRRSEENSENKENSEKQGSKKDGRRMTGAQAGVVVGVAVVTVGVLLWSLWRDGIIGSGDKTQPITDYFEAIAENDYGKYIGSMPKAIAKTYDEYIDGHGLSEESFVRDSYSDYYDILGDSFTVDVRCGEEEKVSDAEIADAEINYERDFGEEVSIKEAYKIYVEVTYKGSRAQETYYYDVYVAKIGFHWYVISIDDYYESTQL